MKSAGIVRQIDELSRIVLLIELRRLMGLNEKGSVEVFIMSKKNEFIHIVRMICR